MLGSYLTSESVDRFYGIRSVRVNTLTQGHPRPTHEFGNQAVRMGTLLRPCLTTTVFTQTPNDHSCTASLFPRSPRRARDRSANNPTMHTALLSSGFWGFTGTQPGFDQYPLIRFTCTLFMPDDIGIRQL